jgi:small-conductance mechanosensitive channel
MLEFLDHEFLGQVIFGASVSRWLLALGLWLLFSLVLISGRAVFLNRLKLIRNRRDLLPFGHILENALRSTLKSLLVVFALYLALAGAGVPDEITGPLGLVIIVLLLFQVGRLGTGIIALGVDRYVEMHPRTPASATKGMGFLARLVLWVFVLLVALSNLGVDITALVTGLGIGGIAVALAIQNILSDIFAYLSILVDEPFVTGDFLVVGEEVGTVEKIGIRTTRLRSLSGEQIIFPNADLLGGRIRNFKSLQERRVLFTIGVVYGTPNDKLAAIPDMIRQIIESQDMTRFDRAHFKAFGDSALQFEIVYYVLRAEYGLFMDIQQAINLEINRRFVEQGIEFAYPTQTLFVNTLGSSEGTTSPAQ